MKKKLTLPKLTIKTPSTVEAEIADYERRIRKMGGTVSSNVLLTPEQHLEFLKYVYEFEAMEHLPEEGGIDLAVELQQRLNPPANPDEMSDKEVEDMLRQMVDLLAQFHLVLVFTDHLTDRQLYLKILTDVVVEPLFLSPDPKGQIMNHDCCPFEDDLEWPDDYPVIVDRKDWIEQLGQKYLYRPLPEFSAPTDDVPGKSRNAQLPGGAGINK